MPEVKALLPHAAPPLLPADELQAWQMAPFADALLAQKRSRPMLRLGARLLRARHERARTRTLERSLVQMQQVVEATEQSQPPVASRMRWAAKVDLAKGEWCPGSGAC